MYKLNMGHLLNNTLLLVSTDTCRVLKQHVQADSDQDNGARTRMKLFIIIV